MAQIMKIEKADNKVVLADENKMMGYMRSGNTQRGVVYGEKANGDAFHATPAQRATLHYYARVLANPAIMIARDAHMPRRQWVILAGDVRSAAGEGGEMGSGGPEPQPNSAQRGNDRIRLGVSTANAKLVAPYSTQIRSLVTYLVLRASREIEMVTIATPYY